MPEPIDNMSESTSPLEEQIDKQNRSISRAQDRVYQSFETISTSLESISKSCGSITTLPVPANRMYGSTSTLQERDNTYSEIPSYGSITSLKVPANRTNGSKSTPEEKDNAYFETVSSVGLDLESLESNDDEDLALDGGWGWLVVMACFIILFLCAIPGGSFGILFSTFLMELKTSPTEIAWIFSLTQVTSNLFGFLLGPLVGELGCRRVTFMFGVVLSMGFIMSSFATSSTFLLFSFSLVAGSSIKILISCAFLILPHYFTRWRHLANSIMTSGMSISHLAMSPVITLLQEVYAFRGATLLLGGLSLNCCVAAMFFHPIEWHTENFSHTLKKDKLKKTKKIYFAASLKRILIATLLSLRNLKSPTIAIVATSLGVNTSIIMNVISILPFAMEEAGYSQWETSFCLFIAGVGNLAAQILASLLGCIPNISDRQVYISGSVTGAFALLGFSLVDSLEGKAVFTGVFGASYGILLSLYSLFIVEELGISKLLTGLSISNFLGGVYCLILGPLIGLVRHRTGSYTASLYFCAACLLMCVALNFLMPAARALEKRWEDDEK